MFGNNAKVTKQMATLLCVTTMSFLPTDYGRASSNVSEETVTEPGNEASPLPETVTEPGNEGSPLPETVTEPGNEGSTLPETVTETGDGSNLLPEEDIVTEHDDTVTDETHYSHVMSDEYFYSDLPIVFTATRLKQTVSETPVSMTIIDEEMIKASGAVEIPELMRLVPGMQVANYGGDQYFVTYHGRADLYSRSLQVLVDGRSVYNPVIGGVAWSDLPLAMEDIERIEVIRGSNAAAFGSNSFSGVINIITKNPSQQYGTLIKTTVSDRNTLQTLARNAGSAGDFDYRVTLKYDKKNGLKTRYDDATNKSITFRGDYKYDSDDKLTFQTGYSTGTQQDDWLLERDTDNASSFQQIKWTHTIDSDSEYSLHFFHNHKKLEDEFTTPVGPFNVITGFSYESDRYELEFQHLLKPLSDLRLAWGAGLRHDSTVSPYTLDQDSAAVRNQIHTFINAEWKPRDNLTVNLGAMLEKYEGFSGLFSPRIALNYALKENHILRISGSRAYRMPNTWEEQIDMKGRDLATNILVDQLHKTVGVPNPEEINSIEIGYMAAFENIPLTMDVKLFKENISPTINYAWDQSTNFGDISNNGAGNFNNDGRIDINGLELQLDYKPTTNTNIHAVYSHLHASGWQVSDYDNSGLPSSYISVKDIVPKETFGLLASHRFSNGIQVSSGFYHTGRVTWLSPGDSTKSYNKWDFRIGKTFTLSDATVDVSAMLHNITDDNYSEYYLDNQAQKELYLQIGVKF